MNNIMSRDLFNEWFGDNNVAKRTIRADVIENEKDYEIIVNMPGYKKENINIALENGYLTISGVVEENEKKKEKNYLRKERYFGRVERTFYIGEGYTEEDIHASLSDGVLNINFPKEVKEVQNKKYISIL